MRADERDDRYPEGGVTREETIEGIAQALLARHQGTTWARGIQDYRDQAAYLLSHADAQDWEFAHGRPSYLAPVGTPPRKPRAEINPKLNEAVQWLTAALAEGPQDSERLRRTAYAEENISPITLRRARETLGIRPKLRAGKWIWELPILEIAAAEGISAGEATALAAVPIVPANPSHVIEQKPAKITISASMSEAEQAEAVRRMILKQE